MASTLTRRWLAASTTLAPVVAAAATPSAGCDKTPTSGIYRMVDQSVNRTYRVFVPSRYRRGTPLPLVMVFHGWGGNESEFLGSKAVRQPAGPGVAPDSETPATAVGAICDPARTGKADRIYGRLHR